MNLLRFFRREPRPPQTAPAARERLQILLTHERSSGSQPDLIAILREEILAVVGKHVKIDPDAVEVRLDRGRDISTLEIEVEVPFVGATARPRRRHKPSPCSISRGSPTTGNAARRPERLPT
jgi:cell division topological specificity factor